MKLSAQQERCKDAVGSWMRECLKSKPPAKQVFKLFGYAGTGKTSIAINLCEDVDGDVMFVAPTGKAALVMREKGCPNTSTIHKLIYRPSKGEGSAADVDDMKQELAMRLEELRRDGLQDDEALADPKVKTLRRAIRDEEERERSPIFKLNPDSELQYASLLVVDEASMVGAQVGMDLLSFGIPILVLGDPGQLPPVKDTGFFVTGKPDFLLTEIHRQAKESPILWLATKARQRENIDFGKYGDCEVTREIGQQRALAADQMIVGKNITRHLNNGRYRQALGFSGDIPQKGERLVCLQNRHELGLLNGSLWRVQNSGPGNTSGNVALDLVSEDGSEEQCVQAHKCLFEGATMSAQELAKDGPPRLSISEYRDEDTQHFDYGYALTCHKSQGSQWDDVIVLDQSSSFGAEANRWLYTAITRAAKRVTIKRT